MKEAEVINRSRLIVGQDNRIALMVNPVGHAVFGRLHTCPRCKHAFRDEKPRHVSFGVGGPGGSDYIGIVRETGRFVGWEFKGDGGKVSDDQKDFLSFVSVCHGSAEVIWSPDDVPAAIERACSDGVR